MARTITELANDVKEIINAHARIDQWLETLLFELETYEPSIVLCACGVELKVEDGYEVKGKVYCAPCYHSRDLGLVAGEKVSHV